MNEKYLGILFFFLGVIFIFFGPFIFHFSLMVMICISAVMFGISSSYFKKSKQEQLQQFLTTICWNCQYQYSYIPNSSGETTVQCPSCGFTGVIK